MPLSVPASAGNGRKRGCDIDLANPGGCLASASWQGGRPPQCSGPERVGTQAVVLPGPVCREGAASAVVSRMAISDAGWTAGS